MNLDLRLYLVTGADAPIDEAARIVEAAVAGGVTLVQLRDKRGDSAARADRARQLAAAGAPVIVNDDVEAAHLANAGVHIGPDDGHPAKVRARLGSGAVIGWSIHAFAQLDDTDAIAACDYLAASPVWPTETKRDTTPPFGLAGVRALREAMPDHLPLVGIGGIDATNAAEVIRAGADGVAVVSAIWAAADPRREAQRLRNAVDAALDERTDAR